MTNARYSGMNAANGRVITDNEHIAQSASDILSTPIGSRVMRRAYGSWLHDLIDQPNNIITRLRIMSAIYSALHVWEPRISLSKVTLSSAGAGQLTATITANRVDNQIPLTITTPLRK